MASEPDRIEELTEPTTERASRAATGGWHAGMLAALMLYLFISAITLMGHGLKTAAGDPGAAQQIASVFDFADNPLVGLCVGVLITSIVQSSSFTTAMTVTFVTGGNLSIPNAIPIIMGANIGTSVTNLLVSMAHIRNRLEFRRALAGAAVHDFFNVLSVGMLFPLEVAFGVLSRPALLLGGWLENAAFFTANPKKFNLVKMATKPFTAAADWVCTDLLALSRPVAGGVIAAAGIVLLFVALAFLVKALRSLMTERFSGLFQKVLFANPVRSFIVGILATALVQSSSVTTSLIVPLVGTGVLRLRQVYPYTLGANVGTTVTAVLAALALAAGGQGSLGLAAAAGHLMFNAYGIAVFWPLRRVPMAMAKAYAKAASTKRVWVAVFVLGLFFVLPLMIIIVAAALR